MRYSELAVSSGIFQKYHNLFIIDGGEETGKRTCRTIIPSYFKNQL